MNGKPLTFFPKPYPDETFYSVVCRYDFRKGTQSFRGTSEELFGNRIALNTYAPTRIGILATRLPKRTGLKTEYFINHTTAFPYFSPFLTKERRDTFLEYMQSDTAGSKSKFFALGTGKLRQPKNLYLRFCVGCWIDDINQYGEPYWHRTHQLPGVFMCHHHGEALMDSPVYSAAANENFFMASEKMMEKGIPCGIFKDSVAEKLIELSVDSEFLMQHGVQFGSYDVILEKYDLWLRKNRFRSYSGRTWPKELHDAIVTYYGEAFLKQVNAFDERAVTWIKRIIFYPDNLQHPMYHILLMRFLTGSALSFFKEKCSETLPYGQGPWPCRNPICPYNLKDVIESIEIRYDMSYCRALFKCPHCGFAYRRKNPIPKEQQYNGTVYIAEHGPLWEAKLIDYLVNQRLTPRQTCELLQCDFYTVNKYAVQLGLWEDGTVTSYSKKIKKALPSKAGKTVLSFDDERTEYRNRWRQLIKEHPKAIRTELILIESKTYTWLRKNDLDWYEKQSPPVQYVYTDWATKDKEYFPIIKAAIEVLRNTEGRPCRITKGTIIRSTGMHLLNRKKALKCLPLTSAYLAENLESIEHWRKRKIRWAVKTIYEQSGRLSMSQILIKSAISKKCFASLEDYASECINEILIQDDRT